MPVQTILLLLSWLCLVHAFVTTPSYRTNDLPSTNLFRRHRPSWMQRTSRVESSVSLSTSAFVERDNEALEDCKVAIVGAGPSGLVLAHALLRAGATVSVYESRPRPSVNAAAMPSSSRAYALGLGRRGRSAIQRAGGDGLWEAVKQVGFESARFNLHLGPLTLTLRKEGDSDNPNDPECNKPSLLLFQNDLCASLTDALDEFSEKEDRLSLHFQSNITAIDFDERTLTRTKSLDGSQMIDSFDLVVGCDGVNSMVRSSIQKAWPDFETTRKQLPGVFKAVRLEQKPPKLDPMAVSLIVDGPTGSAFVEPTVGDSCCILFAGDQSNPLISSKNVTYVQELLWDNFPLLQGIDVMDAAQKLVNNPMGSASSVQCNTYHFCDRAVLVGDAAHATGGVSGQGVNSALVDSVVLANSLVRHYSKTDKSTSLKRALLEYSQAQVPEGKALYDLSFPDSPDSLLGRFRATARNLGDTIFKGRFGIGQLPLQTRLTTSLEPFAEIRRQRQVFYQQPFEDEASWNATLADLAMRSMEVVEKQEVVEKDVVEATQS